MEKFDKDIDLLANSGRAKGVANFAVNFEPGGQAPLDARLLVPTKADLIKPETYVAKNYYKGMAVTIEADGTEYILMDISKITSPDYSGWKQRDSMSTSSSLPSTIITDLTNVTTDSTTATIHSSKVTKSGRDYGNVADDNIVIPSATTSTAGVMTAADKFKLESIKYSDIRLLFKPSPRELVLEVVKESKNPNGGTQIKTDTLIVPEAKFTGQGNMGVISPEYSRKLYYLKYKSYWFKTGPVSEEGLEESYEISMHGIDFNNVHYDEPIATASIYTANTISPGLMSSKDKTHLDLITSSKEGSPGSGTVVKSVYLVGLTTDNPALKVESASFRSNDTFSTTVTLPKARVLPDTEIYVPGLMSAEDKKKVDSLPVNVVGEVSLLQESNEISITVNSSKYDFIAGTYEGPYSNSITILPATTTKVGVMSAQDKINLDQTLPNAISNLEKKEDDHIANKSNPHGVTKAQVGLGKVDNTTDLEKPISTATQNALNAKVQTVNITGSGNAITSASISGTVLTLTKGATYNNNSYSAGTNLSLSGNTFSLNSTISLTRVNASSGFYQTSDKRLKSDIKPLEHSLDDICSIPTDSFILGGKKDLGTIAQELEPTFPELVIDAELKQSDVPNPENFETIEKDGEIYVLVKEVDYAKMSVLAIEGIKLLKAEIDELKKQLLDK